jgi:hypothetical protein
MDRQRMGVIGCKPPSITALERDSEVECLKCVMVGCSGMAR